MLDPGDGVGVGGGGGDRLREQSSPYHPSNGQPDPELSEKLNHLLENIPLPND